MSTAIEDALEILQATNDGDDLAPEHLKLLEVAVNGWLSEAGEVAFQSLAANVRGGYRRPWFHGIEHLTIDHVGYVYWKGQAVEHYELSFAYTEKAKRDANEVDQRCRYLESKGEVPTTKTVIWDWPNEVPA